MRYITNDQIKEKMVLALPIFGPNFEVLLGEDMVLSKGHVQRINILGYAGVYIKDALSDGIAVEDIIPTELRLRTVRSAKEILLQAEKGGEAVKVTRERQNAIIQPVIDAIIASRTKIINLIDLKPYDDYMYYHTATVVILSLLVGLEMGISGVQLYELGMASLLHDVGNIFIPKSILNKPGKLTPEEFEIIKSHSKMGFEYLHEHFDVSIECCMGALQHHENYNGTGYPNNLKKDKISIYGRIIAIADVYDALTSRRPYRQAIFPPAAIDFMEACAGTLFDPEIIEALKNVIALYPAGCCLELDNGVSCIAVENYKGDSARPKVKVIGDTPEPVYMDLHGDPSCAEISVLQIIDYDS